LENESTVDYVIRAENAATALRTSEEVIGDTLLIAMVLKGLPSRFETFSAIIVQRDKREMTFGEFQAADYVGTRRAREVVVVTLGRMLCYLSTTKSLEITHNEKTGNYSGAKLVKRSNVERTPKQFTCRCCRVTSHIINDKSKFIAFDGNFDLSFHGIELADSSKANVLTEANLPKMMWTDAVMALAYIRIDALTIGLVTEVVSSPEATNWKRSMDEEVDSLVARMSSVHVLVQHAVQNKMLVHQMDCVKTAYLNEPIDCDIFVQQPNGYENEGENGEKLVCKLKKSSFYYIITDDKPLGIFKSQNPTSTRIDCWKLRLVPYDCEVVYKPGKHTEHPLLLPILPPPTTPPEPISTICAPTSSPKAKAMKLDEVKKTKKETASDFSPLTNVVRRGNVVVVVRESSPDLQHFVFVEKSKRIRKIKCWVLLPGYLK
ncbi:Hypothetical predicted protein, partial [Paramuricea clavata]